MECHRVSRAPDQIYYIPNFISEEEELHILGEIPSGRWVSLSHRRLQALPARLTATNTLLAAPLPKWLQTPFLERFDRLGIFKDAPHGVNHCLINEYLPGQGIMPHEDGGAYYPMVATVSLGGSIVLDIIEKAKESGDEEKADQKTWRILQEPRSLLVTSGSAYADTLHGIADIAIDSNLNAETVANWDLLGNRDHFTAKGGFNERKTRISLTYRDVKKVSSIGSKIFGKVKT